MKCRRLLAGEGCAGAGAGADLQQGARGAGGRDVLLRGTGIGAEPGRLPRLQPQHQLREDIHRPVGLP